MLFADRARNMRGRVLLATVLIALNGCAEGLAPLSKVPAPTDLVVEPVKLGTVRLTWAEVPDGDVVGYSIERRANLAGAFLPLVDQIPRTGLTQGVYLDTNLEPETYYGYRLYTITRFGDRSSPSVVGGTKSPPLPGIEVRTASLIPSAESVDPDGYELTLIGPDTIRQTIGVSATHRFASLPLGVYQVTLGGVTDRCSIDGQSTQTVTVSDETAQTMVPVAFQVSCRDPSRGEITVTVTSSGASPDGEHIIELLGEASDATLPDSARIVARTATIGSPSGSTKFINLRPGTYEVTLEGLAANCHLEGAATRTVSLVALDRKDVGLNLSCTSETGGGPQEPGYRYRAAWSSLGADQYALDLRIDMRTFDRADITDITTSGFIGDPLTGAQVMVSYDASRLTYDRYEPAPAPNITTQAVNGSTPGTVNVISAVTGVGPTGDVGFARLVFNRKAGSPAGSIITSTVLQAVSSRTGSPGATVNITADVRITEGTLTLGAGGGGGTNPPPIAEANGPYTGTASTPLSLSSTGSTDDGTIASYSWALGDGQTATGASPSVTYLTAGTYTAVLTVTDNLGATDTDQATVTITGTGGGGGNPGYQYRGAWTSLGADEYALELRIDMRTFNRADITDITTSGVTADPLTGAQVSINYDASRLSYNRFESVSSPSITTQSVNGSTPGTVNVISAVTGGGLTGNVGFARLIFTRVAGSANGSVTTSTTLQAAASRTGSPAATVSITADVRVNEATLTIGGGGTTPPPPPPNQSPIAQANGPYTATAGVAVTLSSAGSSDFDGTIASYSWALGNGQTAGGASPAVTYSTAGTYTAVLTVTDDKGATSTDQATVTVSSPVATKPLTWRNVFGPIDVANNQVAITVSYDMRGNVPETPGVEVLATFKVDSLKWDPAVLQFSAINLGPNIIGTSNQANATAGNLGFQGSVSGAQAQGLITIATIRFKLVGTAGSRTTTATALGLLQGAPVTGDFVYNSKTATVEGEFITP